MLHEPFLSWPRAVLFDLDDTLIDSYRNPRAAWRQVVGDVLPALDPAMRDGLGDAVFASVSAHLSSPARRRAWRLTPGTARPPVIAVALADGPAEVQAPEIAVAIAARYVALRHETMRLHEGVPALLGLLSGQGVRLGLVTNGEEMVQRDKLERFGLAAAFDAFHIEGESGFGKPDRRAFLDPLARLGVDPGDAWMVGDDIYYDIVPANALGLRTVLVGDKPSPVPAPETRHHRIEAIGALVQLIRR